MAKSVKTVTVGGRTLAGTNTRAVDTEVGIKPDEPLAAGKAGTLSTRTDNDTGTLTLGSGHGIETGAIIDLYWEGGIQRGVTVGTVSGTSVPIDAGVGDNLPAQDTAIVACVVTVFDVDVVGNTVALAAVVTRQARASCEFQENDGTPIVSLDLAAGEIWDWADVQGVANPFAGVSIGKVVVSNGGIVTTVFTAGLGVNSVV